MRSKPGSSSILLAASGFLILWALLSLASYTLLVQPRQRLFDYYPRWEGARAVLAGENPFTQAVDWRIQEGMYGRRQSSDEIVAKFVYLPTITWLLLPFWLLPYPLSVSLWCGLQLLLLLITPMLVMRLLKWSPPPLSFVALLIFSVFLFRYPINAYILGQFIPFVLICILIAWWGMAGRSPALTLLGLTGVLVRPEVALAPLGALLLHNWLERRRLVVLCWAGIAVALWLLSRLWIGPWEADFLHEVVAYTGYSFMTWLPVDVGNVWLGAVLTLGVAAWGAWIWWSLRRLPGEQRLPWELGVSVLVTLLVLPQPNNYTLALALIPILVALWAGPGKPVDWLAVLALLASPWLFYAFRETLPLFVERTLIPAITGLLLTRSWLHRGRGLRSTGAPA